MSNIITSKTVKIIGFAVALMLVGMVFATALPGKASAQTVESLTAQIQSLLQTITALQAQLAALQGGSAVASSACPYTWSRDLNSGATGDDVKKLQQFLNGSADTQVAAAGAAGSVGNETSFFGPATRGAVVKFQNKYASEVLTPLGLSAGTGYFGASSRAKANSLCTTGTGTPSTPGTPAAPVVTPLGSGLTVSKHLAQPENSLAPADAARTPFTKVNLTASADGAVTVNSLVVERQGLAADTNFAGIALMNEDGTLIGIEKTLNSNHQVTIGTDFTIPAGATKTVIVAGNMAASGTLNAGEIATLAVVAVNTSATVHGNLPISGASHTINATLTIGSISTVARGSLDPGSSQTKEVGTTGYYFASTKWTAGSAEDITLKSIRWYQSGSATSEDLANIKTLVDGVEYPMTVDGRYYTTIFPSGGLLIKKGFSKDVSIRGDVVGGSNRTVDFDIERRTDIHFVGNLYGFGITPPFATNNSSTDNSTFDDNNNPYYDASEVTVSNGTMNVSSWTAGVPAQNIAVNLSDQPIAGFTFDVKGEPVSVTQLAFNFTLVDNSGTSIGLADVTNVIAVDANGTVLAGPADGSGATTKSGAITLSDSITFPVGITNVILKAKLGTNFANNDTVAASTTPSSDFGTVTGQVTGNTITPAPSSAVTGSTQTVKAGAFSVSVSSQPTARTAIAGATQFEFARYIFDVSQSGEDIRVTSLPLYFDTTGTRTDLTNCQLYDGAVSQNTGSNVKNPATADTASSTIIVFDGTGLTLPKGTSKTLSLKCDIKSGVTSLYWWGLDGAATFTAATGLTSGETIAETFNGANGQVMTAAANGSYTVTNDTSVLFRAVQTGVADVTLAKYRFDAGTEEAVDIKAIALQLGNTASNTTTDLVGQKVSIWNGVTKLGEAQFGLGAGNNLDFATSTLSTPVRIASGDSVTLTVKGTFSGHDSNSAAGAFGAVVSVDYDGSNNGLNGNYATGVDSGVTIDGTSGDTSANAVKVYRGLITVSDVTTATTLAAGSDLYKIRLSASSDRDVTLRSLTFNLSVTGISAVSGIQLFGPGGAVNATGVATSTNNNDGVGGNERLKIDFDNTATDRIIQAGTNKDFVLRADTITTLTANNTETIAIKLLQDTAVDNINAPQGGSGLFNVSTVNGLESSASTSDRFIWSPNSTTTHSAAAASNNVLDWTNSRGLPGFPSVDQDMATRVFTH